MARPEEGDESTLESYESPPCRHFHTSAPEAHGRVPAESRDESPAPAANGTQYPEPAEPPYSESNSRAPEYAQCADHSAAAAAETPASEDPDGEREDSNASRGAHEAGSCPL